MCFARTAFVSSGLALATSLPAFAEDTSKPASPAEQKVSAHINWGRQSADAPGAHGE
jgi:hypothetical protein